MTRLYRFCLFTGQPFSVFGTGLVAVIGFVDIGGHDVELETHHTHEVRATRRLRRQDNSLCHRSRINVTGPSLMRLTSIIAPNSPVSTLPGSFSRRIATKRS